MEIPPWLCMGYSHTAIQRHSHIFKKCQFSSGLWPSVFERVKTNQLMVTLVASDMAVCMKTFNQKFLVLCHTHIALYLQPI